MTWYATAMPPLSLNLGGYFHDHLPFSTLYCIHCRLHFHTLHIWHVQEAMNSEQHCWPTIPWDVLKRSLLFPRANCRRSRPLYPSQTPHQAQLIRTMLQTNGLLHPEIQQCFAIAEDFNCLFLSCKTLHRSIMSSFKLCLSGNSYTSCHIHISTNRYRP